MKGQEKAGFGLMEGNEASASESSVESESESQDLFDGLAPETIVFFVMRVRRLFCRRF